MSEQEPLDALVSDTEQRRVVAAELLPAARRADLGQFFTPSRAASLIAALPSLPSTGVLRILDPGAGVGSLTAAIVARAIREAPGLRLDLVAVETDTQVIPYLEQTLAACRAAGESRGVNVAASVLAGDLVTYATGFDRAVGPLSTPFDLVIMNPPYRKLGAASTARQALIADGVDCPNLYCTFLAIGAMVLKPRGQLVAITPRSFANGPYFGAFRRFFLAQMTLDRLHVFESRSTVFSDSDVLQENVVFSATRCGTPGSVTLSVSRGHADEAAKRSVPYCDVLKPGDPNQFLHIPVSDQDPHISDAFSALPGNLAALGIQVSTGRVVDFRAREHLHDQPTAGSAPLIYPGNLRDGGIRWPLAIRKPQAIADTEQTRKLLLPAGHYVVAKRFSAKEERRRVVAVVCDPEDLPAGNIGFENHLNVFHDRNQGLDSQLALGLCLWLNSTILDMHFRTFSGHTQVNATDLRSLRYPSRAQLHALAAALGRGSWPDQEKIDALVTRHIRPPRPAPGLRAQGAGEPASCGPAITRSCSRPRLRSTLPRSGW
ncbi:MAG TPA: Eco57I restriction-modification methylase domain-containing protein [Streptosporangiaceae bacterium]|nr:Eco57I restriction-modification methylase domain-containing protein [Streptosporangiaceae bacterium]